MILGNFDSTFAAHPEMALYIPLIGGTGGNVGTPVSYTHLNNIIEDDFLKLNLEKLFDGKPFVLTGNYPYNISKIGRAHV